MEEAKEADKELAERLTEEGVVLLKNNGALPLAQNAKVTILGHSSTNILVCGTDMAWTEAETYKTNPAKGDNSIRGGDGSGNSLELTIQELELIEQAKQQFGSVIVLINSANPLECDFLTAPNSNVDGKNVLTTDLSGKVAVVTGAGGVLCGYLAKVLARAGAKVALVNRSDAAINQYAAEIIAEGGVAKAYKGNVLSKDDMERIAAQVLVDLGPCDILLNGAGGNNPRATTDKEYFEPGDLEREDIKTFFDLDDDGVNMVFDLNVNGTMIPTQAFAKHMIASGGGNIINISSMNAFVPLTKIPAYSGAKAAVSNFTQWLAVHFSKCNIRVNAIAPGFFSSKQNHALLFNEDGTPTARTKKILDGTPMGRFGRTEELAGGLLFLLNDAAAGFITGIVLPIDGGFSAYSGV